ncbi:MAG: hypothetical protein QOI47_2173 [Actinomycetota bacterium]|jgi:hypothetical protein|nr:hypothetical protein [Actinomycetota bacterium]
MPTKKRDDDQDDEEAPRTDIDPESIKHDVVEYFGADGKDEGQKFIDDRGR